MSKIKISPIQNINIEPIKIGESVDIHIDRLPSFKATLSRFNRNRESAYVFDYSGIKTDFYVTAVRKNDRVKTTA